ncbi:hypothetical protein [Mucilaginibacter jinjuensis]|uniref:Uncharacterized protein n=1 Tax=Mucilaginibacter jinjuensis TaxID=1176721 RepID=A0ABY7TAU4_9SPHI|nr:hypothetical protein [Mucilaginibacter jinjuensis]WCT13354.1 hypothetical protein PQO05_05330 [Mucilaginibacter jinjuensis]
MKLIWPGFSVIFGLADGHLVNKPTGKRSDGLSPYSYQPATVPGYVNFKRLASGLLLNDSGQVGGIQIGIGCQ